MGNDESNSCQIIEPKPKGCCDKLSLYISNGKVDPSQVTCSICFTIFADPRIMKCKQFSFNFRHVFCQQCIGTWGKSSSTTCPYCRIQLKRSKGNFGRADKKTEKKIEKLFLKCRNCCWTGSLCQYSMTFCMQPYLDDDSVPQECEKIDIAQKSCHQIVNEQKKESLQVQKTSQKQQNSSIIQNKSLEPKQAKEAFDIFINTIIELKKTGELQPSLLEDGFFFSPNGDQ